MPRRLPIQPASKTLRTPSAEPGEMAARVNGSRMMISEINVTPLVDIMLVLLIIFMVTAKLVIAPATALPLELPKAATGEATQVIFSIGLLPDGATAVNGQGVASDDAILPLVR